MGVGFQTWYKYIFLSAVDVSIWAYWSALQKREWKDKETIMGKHISSSRYSLIALNGSGVFTYSCPLPQMLSLHIPSH